MKSSRRLFCADATEDGAALPVAAVACTTAEGRAAVPAAAGAVPTVADEAAGEPVVRVGCVTEPEGATLVGEAAAGDGAGVAVELPPHATNRR
jgi:hypothetical protein